MNDLADAIAIIGVYFALMAVLAVAVEAVVSWAKIPLPWLQGKPSPSDVLKEVSQWLPAENNGQKVRAQIAALNKALRQLGEIPIDPQEDVDLAEIVRRVGEATTRHIKNDRDRRAAIRVLAMGLGIGFAFLFQVDTLQLLAPVSAGLAEFWVDRFGLQGAHALGLIMSGVAASAGSSFWHDQSARLRQLKRAAETARQMGT
jgi:hypothetical protein